MIAVVSLIVVLVLSMVVVRVASVALTLTGLSRQLAGFQARSAFTGAGFTTSESEKVMRHPVRRRIIMLLMLLGNAGIITAVSSLILSFVSTDASAGLAGRLWFRLVLLVAGLSVLWTVANSAWVDREMSRIIQTALKRWTNLEVVDYLGLLHLSGGYVVLELAVEADDWLAGKRLTELNLFDEGVLVLGVQKPGGVYLGAPRGDTLLGADDTVILYGHKELLCDLDQRRAGAAGNHEHHAAVARQEEIESREAAVSEGKATEPEEAKEA
ncbi:MAG TPA: TrkA C-terminal domain-containing protein [Pirellulales bacterium]|jgi:hypothetical protein|nr:TrkA C-terminal domain-containing protein [Pirellulales bacterium]